jgi:hypothetical protein
MVNVEEPEFVILKLPLILMLVFMVIFTPLGRSILMFPVKFAAGGHTAPPVDVHAMAEKLRLVGMVNGLEVHV